MRIGALFKIVTGACGIASAIAPWLSGFIPICPPWPSPTTANAAVFVVQIMTAMLVFALWNRSELERVRFVALLVAYHLSVLLLFTYLALFKYTVVTVDEVDPPQMIVVGSVLQPHYETLRQSDPSLSTKKDILRQAGRDPYEAWTAESVDLNSVLLVITWIMMWWLVASFLALLFAYCDPWMARGDQGETF